LFNIASNYGVTHRL